MFNNAILYIIIVIINVIVITVIIFLCAVRTTRRVLTQMLFRPHCRWKVWLRIKMLRQKNYYHRRRRHRRRRQSPPEAFKGVLLHIVAMCMIIPSPPNTIYVFRNVYVRVCVFHHNCPWENNCKCAIIKQLLSCILYHIFGLKAHGGGVGYNVRRGVHYAITITILFRAWLLYGDIEGKRWWDIEIQYNNDIILLWSNEIFHGSECLLSIYKGYSFG